jgi:hypothetical protein
MPSSGLCSDRQCTLMDLFVESCRSISSLADDEQADQICQRDGADADAG